MAHPCNPSCADRFRRAVALLLASAMLSLVTGCGDRGVNVAPRYAAEGSTTYEVSILTILKNAVMVTGEQGSMHELNVRFVVETLETTPDGGAIVELRTQRLVYNNTGQVRQLVLFDSEADDERNRPEDLIPLFREASKLRVRVRMSPAGEATFLDGLEGVEALTAGWQSRDRLNTVFQKFWWEDLAESVFELGSGTPVVRVGDIWKEDFKSTEQGYLSLSGLVERRIASVTADRVEVEDTGGFTVDFSRDAFASLEEAAIDQQSISGRAVWDRKRGRIVEEKRELVLQLSQTWQGMVLAKRHAVSRSLRRVSGGEQAGSEDGGG